MNVKCLRGRTGRQSNSCRVPQNGLHNIWNRYVLRRLRGGEKGDLVLATDWVKIMHGSES